MSGGKTHQKGSGPGNPANQARKTSTPAAAPAVATPAPAAAPAPPSQGNSLTVNIEGTGSVELDGGLFASSAKSSSTAIFSEPTDAILRVADGDFIAWSSAEFADNSSREITVPISGKHQITARFAVVEAVPEDKTASEDKASDYASRLAERFKSRN